MLESCSPVVIGDGYICLLTMTLSGQLPGLLSGSVFSVCLTILTQSSVSVLIQTLLGIEAGIGMVASVDVRPGIDN